MRKLYTLIIAILVGTGAMAQAPEKMSYQAVVRNASNQLIQTQTVGMQISILQGVVTGTPVYTETQTPTTNFNGLVSLEIGSGIVVLGVFNTIDWSNGPYYIKIETDPVGGVNYTISGTTQLMSVPYALHAKTAGNILWSLNGSKAYYNNGNVGIGTNSPTTKLEIKATNNIGANFLINSGNLSSSVGHQFRAYRASGNVYSEGELRLYNTNKFVFKNSFGNSNSDVMTIELSTGNVGIGQTNTAYTPINSKLQVKGGDIYIEDITKGVIMKSPNGQCWRTTVDNTGSLVTAATTCP